MKPKAEKELWCAQCKKAIVGGHRRGSMTTAAGPMHADCYNTMRQRVTQMMLDAIAAGTHEPPEKATQMCQGCGAVIPCFFHKTQDGRWVGTCCTPPAELKRVNDIAARRGGST